MLKHDMEKKQMNILIIQYFSLEPNIGKKLNIRL